jgi:hypothetical protein
MKKYLIAGLLVAGFVTPAFAAQYYVAQNSATHKCSIVSHKPDGKNLTMLGTTGFKTKADAERLRRSRALRGFLLKNRKGGFICRNQV